MTCKRCHQNIETDGLLFFSVDESGNYHSNCPDGEHHEPERADKERANGRNG
jgi:hypothetical protein